MKGGDNMFTNNLAMDYNNQPDKSRMSSQIIPMDIFYAENCNSIKNSDSFSPSILMQSSLIPCDSLPFDYCKRRSDSELKIENITDFNEFEEFEQKANDYDVTFNEVGPNSIIIKSKQNQPKSSNHIKNPFGMVINNTIDQDLIIDNENSENPEILQEQGLSNFSETELKTPKNSREKSPTSQDMLQMHPNYNDHSLQDRISIIQSAPHHSKNLPVIKILEPVAELKKKQLPQQRKSKFVTQDTGKTIIRAEKIREGFRGLEFTGLAFITFNTQKEAMKVYNQWRRSH